MMASEGAATSTSSVCYVEEWAMLAAPPIKTTCCRKLGRTRVVAAVKQANSASRMGMEMVLEELGILKDDSS